MKNQKILRRAIRPVLERLEDRRLMTASPLQPAVSMLASPAAQTASLSQPSVSSVSPANNSGNVLRDQFISANLVVPNGGIDTTTLTSANAFLQRTSDGLLIPANLNTSGSGDLIVLRPLTLLDPNTSYTFTATAGITDLTGASLVPFTSTFTTGTSSTVSDPSLKFQQVALTAAPAKQYTCVTKGPDGKLYASTLDGIIYRFTINADGTLSAPQAITSIQTANGGNRFINGIEFDPASTANNLILWTTNTYYALSNGPDWTGKITRLSGPNLDQVQDYVVGLPRSVRDHVTNQLHFGPDGALYVSQASTTAMGAPDSDWGFRNEHLLTDAILRVDTTAIAARIVGGQGPLNVQTENNPAGNYDPFAAGTPLTLYADGVRNAYDFIFASNGHLYAPVNGSTSGGNTPATPTAIPAGPRIDSTVNGPYTGPAVPGLTNVQQVEDDYLDDIVKGGYYGHPNPARDEWVLDGGNPTAGVDTAEFSAYPVGTLPDRNWRPPAFDFGQHFSADGIIQYRGNAFHGALDGKLLVACYSGPANIEALSIGPAGNIIASNAAISGLNGFNAPVDLAEDNATGFMYVADYGAQKLILVKPIDPSIAVAKTQLLFNDPMDGAPSAAQNLPISNTGTTPLTITAGGLALSGANAALFQLINPPALPLTLQPGASINVAVAFNPTSAAGAGVKAATLTITSNDNKNPSLAITLRGLATTGVGGNNEPSLQHILDLYQIPSFDGDSNPNDTALYNSTEPLTTPNDEVVMPQLIKAGPGAVTIQPMAVFSAASAPSVRFGYYTPGVTSARTQLFTVGAADAQTVNPNFIGSTTFDPGAAAFGLYATFPVFTNADGVTQRDAFSEDSLNTWEPSVPDRRKVRFYTLRNPDGSVVPNAFVVTAEDFTQPDGNDVVAIIRNVIAAPAAPVMSLINPDVLPFNDRMVFSRIQNPNATLGDIVHDTAVLIVQNTGTLPLTISSITLNSAAWQLISPPPVNTVVAANGGTLTLTLKFIATTAPSVPYNETNGSNSAGGGVFNGTLTINSNDSIAPAKIVALAGYWQKDSESSEEPSLQTQINLLGGFQTNIAAGHPSLLTEGATTPTYYGEEILSPYWQAADTTQPVTVQQFMSWRGQGNAVHLQWFAKGAAGSPNSLWTTLSDSDQQVFPQSYGPNNTFIQSLARFTPAASFGWQIDGEYSDDALQTTTNGGGHHVRFYPLRDRSGNLVPNTFIMTMDYGGSVANFDFNDNVYIIQNVRPDLQPAAPFSLTAVAAQNLGISLQWAPNPESNIIGYNVYRSTTATGVFTKLNAALLAAPGYVDAAATAGVTYYYHVTAVTPSAEGFPSTAIAVGPISNTQPPASPGTLTANAISAKQITLTWTDVTAESGYKIERSLDGLTAWSLVATTSANVTVYTDSNLSGSTTYYYRVRAYNPAGDSANSPLASSTTFVGLPNPWNNTDIGSVSTAGNATYAPATSTFTVSGSGDDIYNQADAFQYVYQPITGDGQIIARVTSITNTDPWAKAGVMIRESLAANARHVTMEISAINGAEFEDRSTVGGATSYILPSIYAAPTYWVKLLRNGNVFTGFMSADGINWTQVASVTIPMNSSAFIGLAVTAHNNTAVNTSTFDNVTFGAAPARPPPPHPSPPPRHQITRST